MIGVERCRLVKYDDNYGSYERSFDGEDVWTPIIILNQCYMFVFA